ncbi:MAG: hypothetical protein J7K58_03535 [Euryarchaeota archaeon]|nr:hypothetical protein [Euryarchaeota archaeon]
MISSSTFERILEILAKIQEARGFIEGCHHSYDPEKGAHFAFVMVSFENKRILEEGLKEITGYVQNLDGVLIDIVRLVRYSNKYMTPIFPTYTLVGDPVAIIRFPRLFAIISMIIDALGSGAYSFARMIGENDAKVLYSTHKDVLRALIAENNMKGVIDYLLIGLSYMGLLPKSTSSKEGNRIVIKLKPRIGEMKYLPKDFVVELLSFTRHYIYSLLLEVFKLLGFESKYEVEGLFGQISNIMINTPEGWYRITIK